eukprot:SAG31_NODE_2050_length_6560_cov_2.712119_7_plen_194_part_00
MCRRRSAPGFAARTVSFSSSQRWPLENDTLPLSLENDTLPLSLENDTLPLSLAPGFVDQEWPNDVGGRDDHVLATKLCDQPRRGEGRGAEFEEREGLVLALEALGVRPLHTDHHCVADHVVHAFRAGTTSLPYGAMGRSGGRGAGVGAAASSQRCAAIKAGAKELIRGRSECPRGPSEGQRMGQRRQRARAQP